MLPGKAASWLNTDNLKAAGLTLLRGGVSLLLLWYLISGIQIAELVRTITGISHLYLLAAVALGFVNMAISAWKWQILLTVNGDRPPFVELLKLYYIGKFFNAFLPSTIGGDAAKMYYLYNILEGELRSVTSVVMDRLTGLSAILLLAGTTTLLVFTQLPRTMAVAFLVIAIGGLGLLILVFFTDILQHAMAVAGSTLPRVPFRSKLDDVLTATYTYRHTPALLYAFGIAVLFRLVLIVTNYLLGVGLGMDVSIVYYLLFIPIIELLVLLPISIQGIGVREAAYVFFFTEIGTTPHLALALSLTQFGIDILNSVFGGVIYTLELLFGTSIKSQSSG